MGTEEIRRLFVRLLDLCGIPYDARVYTANQVLVFNLGFDTKGPDATDHWIYFPEEKYCFYRVGFYDNILGQDRTSLYVELGFPSGDRIDPEAWLPRVFHVNRGSQEDVVAQKQLLREKDIHSIGRYGSWTYCSIEDNIAEARALARELNGL